MIDQILPYISNLPTEVAVILLSALPLTELRASLPLALTFFQMETLDAWFFSVLGNLIPIPIMFFLFEPIYEFVKKKIPALQRFIDNKIDSLHKKYKDRYDNIGLLLLVLIVAVPFPGTGVWTGSLLAIIFSIKRTKAIFALVLGLIGASIIVLLLTKGFLQLI